MLTSRAYQILGISTNASKAAIKKAYHRKAMEFHPDKNPGKNTHNAFIEVAEAYEALTKPPKPRARSSQAHSQKSNASNSANKGFHFRSSHHTHRKYQNTANESFEERYERAKRNYEDKFEKKSQKIYEQNLEEYQNGFQRKFAMAMAVIGIMLSIVFTIDHIATPNKSIVEPYELEIEREGHRLIIVKYTMSVRNQNFELNYNEYLYYKQKNTLIIANQTPIFKDIISIDFKNMDRPNSQISINPILNLHNKFYLFLGLFFLPTFSFFIEKPTFNFVFFGIYYNIIAFPLIITYLMLNSMRISRLLSHFFNV